MRTKKLFCQHRVSSHSYWNQWTLPRSKSIKFICLHTIKPKERIQKVDGICFCIQFRDKKHPLKLQLNIYEALFLAEEFLRIHTRNLRYHLSSDFR